MKKLLFALSLCCIIPIFSAHSIKPVKRTIGKLTLSIDPRMEALSAVQVISDYPVIQRNSFYSEKIKNYFQDYDTLYAVKLTNESRRFFNYDAPVTFMLYLTQPEKLKQCLPYSPYLINRAIGEENLENYRIALKEFIQKSRFKDFWKQNQDLYGKILDKTVAASGDMDWIKALEEYYNFSQHSYSIIISPCFQGGYGPQIKAKNGEWDIYSCVSTNVSDNQIPYLDREGLLFYLWHEFSHSYVNPEFEKYGERLKATEKLFKPLRKVMSRQSYPRWETCVNEHVVRAVNLRLTDLHIGHEAYLQTLNYELSQGFIYIEPLLQKLTEYEQLKKTTPITFSDYVPQLLQVFDSLANTNLPDQILAFQGPLNNTLQNDKIAIIYPTNIADSTVSKKVKTHIQRVYESFFNKPANLLLADTVALQKSLDQFSIVVYGNSSNNLFLNRYQAILPFSMSKHELSADQSYTQPNVKIISCQPNPQNPELGMSIYSSLDDQEIIGINNVFHGPEDYVIFLDRSNVLKKGYYFNKASGKWTFTEKK